MTPPKVMRKLLRQYEAAGFTVRHIIPRKGSHWKVWFNEFPDPVFMTFHVDDTRALANNLAQLRRLARAASSAAG